MGAAFVSRQLAEAATVNSRYAVRIARSGLTVLIRTDQKYSFAPSCMRRGLLACAVITPNVLLLLKSVPGAVAPVLAGQVGTVDTVEDIQRRRVRGHGDREAAVVGLDDGDAPPAEHLAADAGLQPWPAFAERQLVDGVDLDVVRHIEPADGPFE